MKIPSESYGSSTSTAPIEVELDTMGAGFDFMPLIGAVVTRWRLILVVGLLCGLTSLLAAMVFIRPSYSASVQLSRYDSPLASDEYRPQAYETGLIFGLISTPDVLQKARAKLALAQAGSTPAGHVQLTIDRNSTLISVTATSPTPAEAVLLANFIGQESVRFTQNLQQLEALESARQLDQQLADNENDRMLVRQRLAAIESQRLQAQLQPTLPLTQLDSSAATPKATSPLGRLYDRVQAARDQLDDLQTRYTDAHPLVREQKARLAALVVQLPKTPNVGELSAPTDPTSKLAASSLNVGFANQSSGYDALSMILGILENRHTTLVTRQRALQPFIQNSPGSLRQLGVATPSDVVRKHSEPFVLAFALLGAIGGAFTLMGVIALRELLDDRVKSGPDLARITGLPLLGTLGDVDEMTQTDKSHWALRNWTTLRGHLRTASGQGLVCGFTSSGAGEGRSTWIELLADSARQCGYTVLVVSADTATGTATSLSPTARASGALSIPTWGTPEFTAMLVANPSQLMEQGMSPQLWPSSSLPLPKGWIWDLDRRQQWQRALHAWKTVDNFVILVDLPPMSSPETMLLVEQMTNVVWLAESHKAEAGETIEYLETLRHARINLVGTVLNRTPSAGKKPRFARWFGRRSLLLATVFGLVASPSSAQPTQTGSAEFSPIAPKASFAVLDSQQRAPWQQRFTLGPGDQLTLHAFGQAASTTSPIVVGPDGRISYLEAQNVMAAGLTIDEFRTELNQQLGKLRNNPEVIVQPLAYRSKRYYVLGSVVKKGAFPLSRPITIIEAVAQAQGLETRVIDRSLVVQADLANSFIARQGRHLPVDFKKLFAEGDLTQNISLEPDDYLYFPAAERALIYVLGEVRFPGPLISSSRTGTLEAISIRGGFSERAWSKRLLVIRGSLKSPQTFIVNANDVLSAKAADFQLQPKDIVYVGSRPWYKAEELLDLAATAFVQAAVVTKTGLSVTPIGDR